MMVNDVLGKHDGNIEHTSMPTLTRNENKHTTSLRLWEYTVSRGYIYSHYMYSLGTSFYLYQTAITVTLG